MIRLAALLWVLAALLLAAPAQATIALVNTAQGSNQGSGTATSTGAFSVSSGNLLVVACRQAATVTNTVSDTAGNTFTAITSVGFNGSNLIQIFYAKNTISNASDVVTCNFSGGASFTITLALQYSGADTSSPLDTSATGFSGSGTSITSGAFTTTQANEVIVAAFSVNALGNTFTAGSGYTIEVKDASPFGAAEDQIVSSIQTGVTATATQGGGNAWEIVVATFKAAAGGGPSCPKTLAMAGAGC